MSSQPPLRYFIFVSDRGIEIRYLIVMSLSGPMSKMLLLNLDELVLF